MSQTSSTGSSSRCRSEEASPAQQLTQNLASRVLLAGLRPSAFILISIYELTGTLYWIPKATLAAILVTTVWQIITPLKTFYSYWRTSLADFIASMVCFWLTLFISVEIGIAFGVGFSVLHLLLRMMFTRLTPVTDSNISTLYPGQLSSSDLPADTKIFKFRISIVFTNAYRIKTTLLNTIQVYSSGPPVSEERKPETDSGATKAAVK